MRASRSSHTRPELPGGYQGGRAPLGDEYCGHQKSQNHSMEGMKPSQHPLS